MSSQLLTSTDSIDVINEYEMFMLGTHEINDDKLMEKVETLIPYYLFTKETEKIMQKYYIDDILSVHERKVLLGAIYLSQDVLLLTEEGRVLTQLPNL